jgi:hypothetical protein
VLSPISEGLVGVTVIVKLSRDMKVDEGIKEAVTFYPT